MSEEVKEAPKKKGKLPIIIVLVLVLAGGGFFGMKMKGGKKDEKKVIELGTVVPLEHEFLSNLKEDDSYVRATFALHLRKDYDAKKLEGNLHAVQDAIYLILKSKSTRDLKSVDQMKSLKKEIAKALNAVLEEEEPEEAKPEEEEKPKKSAKKKEVVEDVPEDWDSATGPVLKVYYSSFAMQ